MTNLKAIANFIKERDNFLIISHASPDGDTIGSATALIRALRSIGKKANFSCSDPVHKNFSYLFENLENEEFTPDTFIAVDVASTQLLGSFKDKYDIDVVIDHHLSNNLEAPLKYVDHTSPSNTMIMYELINIMEIEICPKIANSLYTGLATDTGCFKFSNTNAKAHIVAGKLFEKGADFSFVNKIMFDRKTLASLKIESEVFSKLEWYNQGKILLASISREMLERNQADEEDILAIPSIVRSIEGVLIGITIKEKEDGMWKSSVRAIAPADANVICQKLGGGGHRGAGGCALCSDFEKSKEMIINACKEYLQENNL